MLLYWFLVILGIMAVFFCFIAIYKKYDNDFIIFLGLLLGGGSLLLGIILGCYNLQTKTPSVLYILFIIFSCPIWFVINDAIKGYKFLKEEKRIQKQREMYKKEQEREKELKKIITNTKIKLYL